MAKPLTFEEFERGVPASQSDVLSIFAAWEARQPEVDAAVALLRRWGKLPASLLHFPAWDTPELRTLKALLDDTKEILEGYDG